MPSQLLLVGNLLLRFHFELPMTNYSAQNDAEKGAGRTGKYRNFLDPRGLLLRMLKSRNRSAYSALFRAGLTVGVQPLDWAMQGKERRLLAAAGQRPAKYPLVLIAGSPRSGSTLLYQTLARYADVSYLTNLSSMFPLAPISATRMFHKTSGQTRPDFKSYYGQTSEWISPNDGFDVWNRWLGDDRYNIPTAFETHTAKELRQFFSAWVNTFDKPFLNKNNRNTACVQLLAETLPQATFIIIRRESLFVAQSLIEARLQVQGTKHCPWGLGSVNEHEQTNDPLGYVEDVCNQIQSIENRLDQQLLTIDSSRYIEVGYEDFCSDPTGTLRRIREAIPGLRLREERMEADLNPFTVSSTLRISKEEYDRIKGRFADAVPQPSRDRQYTEAEPS